ncbi:hypothetical protein GOV10_03935 [Candidatus Woesearchaeota archaeon]|nr:hypothetical protein [Candidatus Woesearchaeota archaeon]
MEDPKLVDYFKTAVKKAEDQGYDDKTIHASMHEASPKRVWQEKAYLALVDGAAVNLAIMALVLIYFGSAFITGNSTEFYIFAFLLMFPAGLLYYFAHGAFEFHAGKKVLMSFFTSVILSSVVWFMYTILDKLMIAISEQLGKYKGSLAEAAQASQQLVNAGLDVPNIPQIPESFFTIFSGPPQIDIVAMIIIIIIAYNFIPLLFYIKEKIVDSDAIKVKAKEQENTNQETKK